MGEDRLRKDIETDVRKDFVQNNALRTHNFDKFWFHFLWVTVLLLLILGGGAWIWFRH
jgi:hypothetical protein